MLAPSERLFSRFPILLAVLTAYALAWLMTVAGVFTGATAVDFSGAGATPWVRGVEVGAGGVLFPWSTPLFDFTFIVVFLVAYLASAIESFGDNHVGGFASTSYSENIGLVGLRKVASRRAVLLGAGILIVLGVVSKVGGVITTIPTPIVGGIYLSLFGLIAAVGLSTLRRANMGSQRNLVIAGFMLFSGYVFPEHFATVEDFSFFGVGWATNLVSSVVSSGIATVAILRIVLDNVIPGTDAERGIGGFEQGVVPPKAL